VFLCKGPSFRHHSRGQRSQQGSSGHRTVNTFGGFGGFGGFGHSAFDNDPFFNGGG